MSVRWEPSFSMRLTDRRTDMTALIVAIRNFANALKKKLESSGRQFCQQLWKFTLPTVVLCPGSVPKCKHCVTCFELPINKAIKNVKVATFNFTAPGPASVTSYQKGGFMKFDPTEFQQIWRRETEFLWTMTAFQLVNKYPAYPALYTTSVHQCVHSNCHRCLSERDQSNPHCYDPFP